jgi:hypothetical protein
VKGYQAFMDGFVAMLTGVSTFAAYGDDTTALTFPQHPPAAHPHSPTVRRSRCAATKSARIDGSTAIFESLRVMTAVAASFMPC